MGIETSHDDRADTANPAVSSSAPLSWDKEYAWPRARRTMQDAFSEFFGVFIMILFGDGSVAQVTLSENKSGEYQSISWGWG